MKRAFYYIEQIAQQSSLLERFCQRLGKSLMRLVIFGVYFASIFSARGFYFDYAVNTDNQYCFSNNVGGENKGKPDMVLHKEFASKFKVPKKITFTEAAFDSNDQRQRLTACHLPSLSRLSFLSHPIIYSGRDIIHLQGVFKLPKLICRFLSDVSPPVVA